MKEVTPKTLRSNLKKYLELAEKEAIRIKRRSGKKFILIEESNFQDLKHKLTPEKTKTTKRLTKVSKKVMKKKVKAKKNHKK